MTFRTSCEKKLKDELCGNLGQIFVKVICQNYINNTNYGKQFPTNVTKIAVTRCQISRAKMHQIRFRPLGELTALPRPIAEFKATLVGKDLGRGREENGEGNGLGRED